MNIAIYSRKSRFSVSGDSIENQVQLCKEYAIRSDYKEAHFIIYEDEGFSGKNTNRPKFLELIEDIKTKKIDVLMCYRLDRISRNVSDFSSTLELLQAHNVSFVSIKEQFDTSTPMGRAMIYIASVFAQLERETIAERVRDNMIELAKNGYWLGGTTPLGYTSIPIHYLDSDMTERKMFKLTKNEAEIEIVQLIYKKYLELKSLNKVETYLMQHHYKTRKNRFYSLSSLKFILTNPVYVRATEEILTYLRTLGMNVNGVPDGKHGILVYNKTKAASGKTTKNTRNISEWIATISKHNGILDSKTWLEVQKTLSNNRDRYPNIGKTHHALLTGVLKCKCGSLMRINHGHISAKTGQCIYYYSCTLKKRSKGSCCSNGNAKVNDIDKAVLDYIESISLKKELALATFIELSKLQKKENPTSQNNLTSLITAKQNQLDNLVNKLSMVDDEVAPMLLTKIKDLKSEITSHEEELKSIQSPHLTPQNQEIERTLLQIVLDKCTHIKKLSFEEQQQLIRALFKTIIWDAETKSLLLEPIEDII